VYAEKDKFTTSTSKPKSTTTNTSTSTPILATAAPHKPTPPSATPTSANANIHNIPTQKKTPPTTPSPILPIATPTPAIPKEFKRLPTGKEAENKHARWDIVNGVWKVDSDIGTQLRELSELKEKEKDRDTKILKEAQELQAFKTAKELELKVLKGAKEAKEREMGVLREVKEREIRELKEKTARETQELLKELQELRALKEVKEKEVRELKARGAHEVQEATKEVKMLPRGGEAEKAKWAVFDRARGGWRGVNTEDREKREWLIFHESLIHSVY
jgi:hypothetical protein